MSHPPPISIIIPTKNAGTDFAELLRRLASQKIAAPIELFIIDSSSTDDTVQRAKQAGAKTQIIPAKSFNHGQTRNRAIAQTTGDPIVLLSQDALPADDNLLQNLTRNFEDPLVAGVFARHLPRPDHGPLIQHHVNHFCSDPNRRESQIPDPAAYHQLPPLARLAIARFDNVCSAIRRSVWQAHPFPPRRFAEDLAWSQRILLCPYKAGDGIVAQRERRPSLKIVYDPTALVIHSHNHSLGEHYHRVLQTHRALRELFALSAIPHAHQIPAHFLRALRTDSSAILHAKSPPLQKLHDLLRLPAHTLTTLLAIHHASRPCPLNHAARATSAHPQ